MSLWSSEGSYLWFLIFVLVSNPFSFRFPLSFSLPSFSSLLLPTSLVVSLLPFRFLLLPRCDESPGVPRVGVVNRREVRLGDFGVRYCPLHLGSSVTVPSEIQWRNEQNPHKEPGWDLEENDGKFSKNFLTRRQKGREFCQVPGVRNVLFCYKDSVSLSSIQLLGQYQVGRQVTDLEEMSLGHVRGSGEFGEVMVPSTGENSSRNTSQS